MKGRKPLPPAMKVLRGFAGHRDTKAAQLDAMRAKPDDAFESEPPPHLVGEALAEWHARLPVLQTLRVLTRADRAIFAAYCFYWGEWVTYCRTVEEQGAYSVQVVRDEKGRPIPGRTYPLFNPAKSIRDKAYDCWRAAAVELGLTPSSRSRVSKDGATGPVGLEKLRQALKG